MLFTFSRILRRQKVGHKSSGAKSVRFCKSPERATKKLDLLPKTSKITIILQCGLLQAKVVLAHAFGLKYDQTVHSALLRSFYEQLLILMRFHSWGSHVEGVNWF
jgi:hypothetical protein